MERGHDALKPYHTRRPWPAPTTHTSHHDFRNYGGQIGVDNRENGPEQMPSPDPGPDPKQPDTTHYTTQQNNSAEDRNYPVCATLKSETGLPIQHTEKNKTWFTGTFLSETLKD